MKKSQAQKSIHNVTVYKLFLTLCDTMDCIVHEIFQARILEWVAFPFSRDLPNPGIKPWSPTLQADSLPTEPQGSPRILEWVDFPFFIESSQPRNWTGVSCIAGRFFTNWAIREAPYKMFKNRQNKCAREEVKIVILWVCVCTVCLSKEECGSIPGCHNHSISWSGLMITWVHKYIKHSTRNQGGNFSP